MENLPSEIFFLVCIHLDIKRFAPIFSVNRKFHQLDQDRFWQYYNQHFYHAPPQQIQTTSSQKEFAIKLFTRLRSIWKRNLYPSFNTLPLLLTLTDDFDQQYLEEYEDRPRLLSIRDFDQYTDIENFKIIKRPTLPNVTTTITRRIDYINLFRKFNKSEIDYLKQMQKYVHRSTPYLTPDGVKTINYDIDTLESIGFEDDPLASSNDGWLSQYLYNLFSIEEQFIAIENF